MSHKEQDKSDTLCNTFARLDRYRVSQNITWKDVARRLGIGVSMLMMVKSGQRNLSKKALFALQQAEESLGLNSPNVTALLQLPVLNPHAHTDFDSIKKLKISELKKAIEEIRRGQDALVRGLEDLEKAIDELSRE